MKRKIKSLTLLTPRLQASSTFIFIIMTWWSISSTSSWAYTSKLQNLTNNRNSNRRRRRREKNATKCSGEGFLLIIQPKVSGLRVLDDFQTPKWVSPLSAHGITGTSKCSKNPTTIIIIIMTTIAYEAKSLMPLNRDDAMLLWLQTWRPDMKPSHLKINHKFLIKHDKFHPRPPKIPSCTNRQTLYREVIVLHHSLTTCQVRSILESVQWAMDAKALPSVVFFYFNSSATN